MNKKKGAAPSEPPSPQLLTSTHNRYNRCDCQAEVPVPASIKTRSTAERGGKKGRFYKPLPIQFRIYRQIAREGDVAIYAQGWTSCTDPSVCYEVIRIRRHEGFQIAGKFIEPAEVYPRSEAWGVDGFTFTDKDAAFNKFRQIVAGKTGTPNLEQTGDGLDQEQTQPKPQPSTGTENEELSCLQ